MTSSVPLDGRLYGAAQQLLLGYLCGSGARAADRRGVVQEQDAVDAAMMLFATIQEQVRAARVGAEVGTRMAALLMLVRDFIRPLPAGLAADGSDLLTADLAEMVEVVRLTRIGQHASPSPTDTDGERAIDE